MDFSPLLEGIEERHCRDAMTQLFENEEKFLAEATQLFDVDTYTKIIYPLIRRVWPELVANYVVSVQPIDAPTGIIRHFRIYRTTGGDVQVPPLTTGSNPYDYSMTTSRTHTDSTSADGSTKGFTRSLSDIGSGYEIHPTSLVITATVSAATVTLTSDVDGNISGSGGSGSVNFVTKAVELIFTVAPDNSEDIVYTWRDHSGTMSPKEVKVALAKTPVYASTRKLKATWELEIEQDIAALHDLDLAAEIVDAMANEIMHEIDYEILYDLHANVATTGTWDATHPGNWTTGQKQWHETAIIPINDISAQLYESQRRGGANFIVASPRGAAYLKDIGSFESDKKNVMASPFRVGTVVAGTIADGAYTVLQSMAWKEINQNSWLLVYKGAQLADSGYVYSPYVPIQLTPPVYNTTTGQPIRFMMTRYAKKLFDTNFWAELTIKGFGQASSY